MKLLIYVPLPRGTTRGNWITGTRWAAILRELGHTVKLVAPSEFDAHSAADYDVLIALHARRSHSAVHALRAISQHSAVVVALTGTDLQSDLCSETDRSTMVLQSLEIADRIILLEPEGLKLLPHTLHSKCHVILQSSKTIAKTTPPDERIFQVTILAHLRDVKDPFLIAKAADLLPKESKLKILHLGSATSEKWELLAQEWTNRSPRYNWIGAVPHLRAQEILAGSRLTVLTSHQEGAPSVFSEAAVCGVPVLSTRICAAIGIFGRDYPGLYDVGNEHQLAELLWAAESNELFYQQLLQRTVSLKNKFSPELESQAWKSLIVGLTKSP